jgi:hypothetical protein
MKTQKITEMLSDAHVSSQTPAASIEKAGHLSFLPFSVIT